MNSKRYEKELEYIAELLRTDLSGYEGDPSEALATILLENNVRTEAGTVKDIIDVFDNDMQCPAMMIGRWVLPNGKMVSIDSGYVKEWWYKAGRMELLSRICDPLEDKYEPKTEQPCEYCNDDETCSLHSDEEVLEYCVYGPCKDEKCTRRKGGDAE